MTRELNIGALYPELARWIDLVCAAGDEHVRDRVLLECVLALGVAEAAALWRPVHSGPETTWRSVLARGPASALPGPGPFDALRRRELPATAIGRVRVFAGLEVALALGGVDVDDERLDLVEALLFTYELMDARASGQQIAPPLPSAPRDSADARALRHDINNVLTSLRATEDLLGRFSDGLSAEETTRFRAVVEHECARVGALLASALRTDARPAETACDPALVVERVLDAERAACEHARMQVQRFVDPAARGACIGLSSSDFGRLVQNLIVNAREANLGRPGAHLWVTLATTGPALSPAVHLVVEDDGPGLPAELLARVFESGFTTKSGDSSGHGLAIVRSLAEQAGGTARAGLRALGGCRFEVHLPHNGTRE